MPYAAPEMVTKDNALICCASDTFSMGCILYFTMSHQSLFDDFYVGEVDSMSREDWTMHLAMTRMLSQQDFHPKVKMTKNAKKYFTLYTHW
eukprot:CAMPEP_0195507406 /NCGR_PEP_ID=MMETSP0794_2-20130614/864_1 /TAXON_ID=515487 /ORGANISM="Stephanopyxis turris, Strain CCMP 815" /LENGTH=90 /DNA_ID=CAMNT_0040634081 /DNA_START=1312 /DNA_END=1581 /DNA_ORIENTATION=-